MPARRSRGSGCAARCRAPSSARSSTKAGHRTPRRRARWPRAARSRSSPAITTPRSARWPASSARRCRSGSCATRAHGHRAYCQPQRRARQGAALRRQRPGRASTGCAGWRAMLAPVLAAALEALGPIELKPLIAQALHMGDEVHNRNAAATGLLLKRLVPAMLKSESSRDASRGGGRVHRGQRPLLPQPLDGRVQGDAGRGARRPEQHHGHRDGAQRRRVRHPGERHRRPLVHRAGAGGRRALFRRLQHRRRGTRPRRQRHHRDRGPRRLRDGGGAGHRQVRRRHRRRCARQHRARWATSRSARTRPSRCPRSNFAGTPAGIDVRKVVDTGILPIINTGIAHKAPGIGQIGAGITHAPLACFTQAVVALAEQLGGG